MEEDNKNVVDEDDDQDSEAEDNDNEVERVKSHHNRRRSKTAIVEQKRSNLFKPHPLNLSMVIGSKVATNGTISLIFSYLPTLGIVSVAPNLNNEFSLSPIASEQVVAANSILDALFPDDFGTTSPNPKSNYQLQDLSLDPKDFLSFLSGKHLGKPYKWAQNICGIDFIAPSTPHSSESMNDLCQKYVPTLVRKIRSRWLCRLSLFRQIQALEQRNLDLPSSSTVEHAHRISSNLTKWQSIAWSDYNNAEATKKFVNENLVTENDLLFEGVLKRDSAKMVLYLAVGSNFPNDHPLWAINLIWNGVHNSTNNAAIRVRALLSIK